MNVMWLRFGKLLENNKKENRMDKLNCEFFWGGPFSQWAYSPFVVDGITFENAEKWMMYHKAKTFNDQEALNQILALEDPQVIKAIGRKVKNFNAEHWSSVSYEIVKMGNIHKFEQNPEMKDYLMSTGDKEIVEASPYDRIWGIGIGPSDPKRFESKYWNGENLLGKVIMDVREYFKGNV